MRSFSSHPLPYTRFPDASVDKSICCSTALPLEFARAPVAHTGFYALRIAHRDSRSVRAIVRSDARVRVCSLIKHSRSLVRRGTYKMLVVCLTCSG